MVQLTPHSQVDRRQFTNSIFWLKRPDLPANLELFGTLKLLGENAVDQVQVVSSAGGAEARKDL